jgi:PAS domain S-box-containing protein
MDLLARHAADYLERKHAEEAMRGSEERLSGLINSAMDAVITVNGGQRVVLFNPAAEKMFGVAVGEALGSSLDRFIPARFRQAHRGHIEQFGQTGVTTRRMAALGALSGLRADGEEFPIEASISQIMVGGERLFTVILRDVTERQKAEEVLRRSNEELEQLVRQRTAKLQELVGELEHFSYTITHDMRAPLRAMRAFAEMLKEDEQQRLGADQRNFVGRIVAGAERMDALIIDALNYSKAVRSELPLGPVDVERLLRGILDTYPEFQAAEIAIAGKLPLVMGNEAALTQCFSNLIGNAVKFVQPGAMAKVKIWGEVLAHGHYADRHDADGRHPGRQQPGWVRLWVEDSGIGISKEMLPRVFHMFAHGSNPQAGTGIGLALARKVVERMGGRIGVETELGRGSRFWVELKMGDVKHAAAQTVPGVGAPAV